MDTQTGTQTNRIHSIDLLRGLVMIIMALDHVRMYFALGTWYTEPTNLATTTPLLFFTRWITHFCFAWTAVYAIWIVLVILLYPVCRGYQTYREKNPSQWWLRYL